MAKAKKHDFLVEKHHKLCSYQNSFKTTMSVMCQSVDILGQIINGIDETIEDIESYQQGLNQTKSDLQKEKEHNQKVLGNLKQLLCIE